MLSKRLDSLLPDGLIRHVDGYRMLGRWEEQKAGQLLQAIADIKNKMAATWHEVFYGLIEYLLTFAAAGARLQFQAVLRDKMWSTPVAVGPVLELDSLVGKATLALVAIQYYRFLGAMAAVMPETVAPANKLLTATVQGITRTIYFGETGTVIKCIHPWSAFRKKFSLTIDDLKAVYQKTKDQRGLVHCQDIAFDKEKDTLTLTLIPVGLPPESAVPETEAQLACAAYGGLSGLANLHKIRRAHRDVRSSNFTCDARKMNYFWLDLELCGGFGVPAFSISTWNDLGQSPLVNGAYTSASDIYCFGRMLQRWAGLAVTDEGRSLLQSLVKPASEQQSTAADLLPAATAWLVRLGVNLPL